MEKNCFSQGSHFKKITDKVEQGLDWNIGQLGDCLKDIFVYLINFFI